MFNEKTVNPPPRRSNAPVVICLLLLIGTGPAMQAQDPPPSSKDVQVRRKFELHTRGKAKVIAEGKNSNALEQLRVDRYTVEELQLDESVEAEIEGKKTEVYQAYRITVFGGPFDVRAMPLVLVIDDKTTLFGVQGRNLDKATFLLYDRSLLREGATLAVGYGTASIELTDKLRLGEKRQ